MATRKSRRSKFFLFWFRLCGVDIYSKKQHNKKFFSDDPQNIRTENLNFSHLSKFSPKPILISSGKFWEERYFNFMFARKIWTIGVSLVALENFEPAQMAKYLVKTIDRWYGLRVEWEMKVSQSILYLQIWDKAGEVSKFIVLCVL